MAGVGKTRVLHQAALQTLQLRSWSNSVYHIVNGKDSDPTRALAARLKLPIPPDTPASCVTARLAHAISFGQRCGLVLDGIVSTSALERMVEWARALRVHAPSIQVLFGFRLDSGAPMSTDICHVHVAPLRDAVADTLMERAAVVHAHQRLGMPLPVQSSSTLCALPACSMASTAELAAAVADGSEATISEADLASIVEPLLALAREGLRLCRGVPLLLHVLLRVSLSCALAPQTHDAATALKSNLQVRVQQIEQHRPLESAPVSYTHLTLPTTPYV